MYSNSSQKQLIMRPQYVMLLFVDLSVGSEESQAKRHCLDQNMSQPHGQVQHSTLLKEILNRVRQKHLTVFKMK
jgi:hypothetical protein